MKLMYKMYLKLNFKYMYMLFKSFAKIFNSDTEAYKTRIFNDYINDIANKFKIYNLCIHMY